MAMATATATAAGLAVAALAATAAAAALPAAAPRPARGAAASSPRATAGPAIGPGVIAGGGGGGSGGGGSCWLLDPGCRVGHMMSCLDEWVWGADCLCAPGRAGGGVSCCWRGGPAVLGPVGWYYVREETAVVCGYSGTLVICNV